MRNISQFGRLYYTPRPVYCYYCRNAKSLMNNFKKNELHFLQTMEYEILSKIVPGYRNQIRVWQWPAVQYTWEHRGELGNFPADDLEMYRNWNRKIGNVWCLQMLNWKTDSRWTRIRTALCYGIMILQRYEGNFGYALRRRIIKLRKGRFS